MAKLSKHWQLEYAILTLLGKDHDAVVQHQTITRRDPKVKVEWYWEIEGDNSRCILDDKAPDMLTALLTAQDALDFVERTYKKDGNYDNVTLRNFKRLQRARKITPKTTTKGKK